MPAAPLWLLLLLPWAALVLYLFTAARRQISVPFVQLWQSQQSPPRRRNMHSPPLPILLALLAILLSILAAARPILPGGAHWKIILLIDRGFTMPLQPTPAIAADQIQFIPDQTNAPIDTRPLLGPAIDKALRDPATIVILDSNQKIDRADPRLIQMVPPPIENVGFTDLQIRLTPHPQAMIRIRNDSPKTRADLFLTGTLPFSIDLPPTGIEKNYFLDLPQSPPIIQARISPGGDISADDNFATARHQTWPRLELQTSADEPLRRMIAVYQHDRPPDDDSPILPITDTPTNTPCILLPSASEFSHPLTSDALKIESSPLTAGIDWTSFPADTTAADLPPGDWHILLSRGPQPLLAFRPTPRQVWVGFHSPAWSATSDYVIFWTKLFDWTGNSGDTYSWLPVSLPAHPTPGIFTVDGQTVAINAPAIPLDPPAQTDWHAQLQAAETTTPPGSPDISRWLLLAALALLVVAGATWPPR